MNRSWRSGSALPSLSVAAQVSRCTTNALCSGSSQRCASGTSATWGDEQDRSMGCGRGRKWKPYLCRTEARDNERRAAPRAHRRHNRRPLEWHRPPAGRRRFYSCRNSSYLGEGIVVFEVQQNSDVTFRLYDWGHIDAKTGQLRPLQVDQAIPASILIGKQRPGNASRRDHDAS